MIIGITGTDGSGKGSVAEYLGSEKGFVHYSARIIWIEEIKKQGLEINRENMRLMANKLRGEYGHDYLVTYYLDKMRSEQAKDVIIESIRATAEADTLKKEGGILIAVDADQRLRYERIQARKSASDQISFDKFQKHEAMEMNDPDPNGMQKAKVMEMADYTIMNEGSVEELCDKVEEVLKKIEHLSR